MDFLYQCDEGYAAFTGVSMYSLLENNKGIDRIRVFIVDDGISEDNLGRLSRCAEAYQREIVFITGKTLADVPDVQEMQSYRGSRKNKRSFLKVLAFSELPEDVEKVLYLDSDTLVMGSLKEIEAVNIEGYILAMVLDSLVDKNKKFINFERSDPYYNSGVIYVNVKRWKNEDCRSRVVEHGKNHSYGTVDQDILNIAFKDEILTLQPKYNFQPHHLAYSERDYFAVITHKGGKYYSSEEIRESRNDIKIMHFFRYLGEQPWHLDNVHPCNDYFDDYLAGSLWRDYKKQRSQRSILFKIERTLYIILPARAFLRLFMIFFTMKLKRDNKSCQR